MTAATHATTIRMTAENDATIHELCSAALAHPSTSHAYAAAVTSSYSHCPFFAPTQA